MGQALREILEGYNHHAPLAEAYTIPAVWYVLPEIAELERRMVFHRTWQVVGRTGQVARPGEYFTADVVGEPIVVVRGDDGMLRAFYNVCRHHAAIVACEPFGCATNFRCSYHGWTYGTDGVLKGITEFEGVKNFERADNGLVPVRVESWEQFVLVNLDPLAPPLPDFLGRLVGHVAPLDVSSLNFFDRRSYVIDCNWKVYVDNFLDGGYHVPHMHKGLNSVLDYTRYTIENEDRACIQKSPLAKDEESDATAASTRQGNSGYYFWQYPNFMLNWYQGLMDTNLVLPRGPNQCEVIVDFYFADISPAAEKFNRDSVRVADQVQKEDTAICMSVQRGLHSAAYRAGRLSVRREAGEHLFHRLLYADLVKGATE
jgi:choline monooxygenase